MKNWGCSQLMKKVELIKMILDYARDTAWWPRSITRLEQYRCVSMKTTPILTLVEHAINAEFYISINYLKAHFFIG